MERQFADRFVSVCPSAIAVGSGDPYTIDYERQLYGKIIARRYSRCVAFGLAGWVHGEDALFARLEILQQLLAASSYTLVWWLRGERGAFVNLSSHNSKESAWADYHGLAYLSANGQVQTVWLQKDVRD